MNCFRLSVLFEKETEDFHKQDPDPFDDRHPGNSMNNHWFEMYR